MVAQVKQPLCMIVIDGWGISDSDHLKGDAIHYAKTPVMDKLAKEYPYTEVQAHGTAVGLVKGLMGNSEVGHLNIGAGRVVWQDMVKINVAIEEGKFKDNQVINKSFDHAKSGNGRMHLIGLVSDGGVHSHQDHLEAILKIAKSKGVKETYIHFFGDGRDTNPKSTAKYIQKLLDFIKKENDGVGKLATVTGRYYAMDRDKRWERVERALNCLVKGEGERTADHDSIVKVVEDCYSKDETDEFLKPILVNKEGTIRDNDTLFVFNFRADRIRQIVQALGSNSTNIFAPTGAAKCTEKPPLPKFGDLPKDLHISTMAQYKGDFPFPVAFPRQSMDNVLGEWLAKQGLKQYHCAETEKYAHVTFFFNGGSETQFENEERELIPSPKVATYDLQPEMSAKEVGHAVANAVKSRKYDFLMCNFAPPDMVGHTGKYEPAIKGVEATDAAIGTIYKACKEANACLMVTADHGNAEKMIGDEGDPHTAHTTSRVPFVMTGTSLKFSVDRKGGKCRLADVAPTALEAMGLKKPAEMDGDSLIKH